MDRIVIERFREALANAGLTRNAAGSACGLSPSTVWRIATSDDRFRNCQRTTLIRIAQGLKVSPSWLAGGAIYSTAGLWPTLVPKSDPPEQMVLDQLRATPTRIRVAAARGAVAAIMAAQLARGMTPPKEAYEALYILDAIKATEDADAGPSASLTA